MRSFSVTAFTLCWILTAPAAAQVGTIVGSVMDAETGETLPGVTVLLDGSFRTTTDSGGRFEFLNVSPGEHEITVRFIGHHSERLTVSPGQMLSFTGESLSISAEYSGVPVDNPKVTVHSKGRTSDRIYIDDKFKASTPATITVERGRHSFRVTDPDSGDLLCRWATTLELGESRCYECSPSSKKVTRC